MLNMAMQDLSPERFHPRVAANFMVKAMVQGRLVVTKAKDLSMAGMSLIGPIGVEGEKVTVAIPLPHDREILTAGRITRELDDGVALEFDPLDWDDMFALARYLHPRLP
jgi:hypothetical protein